MDKTLREIVGQLLMIGFGGTTVTTELIDWIQEYRPGGVILFSRNLVDPEQIARLTNALQDAAPGPPLFIAIDQEGGRVSRLPKGFTIFPAAATVAACRSTDVVYSTAEVTAKELRAVGINMNMAPVLDVNTNAANPIIGNRAFGETPEDVCSFGVAAMAGLQDNGVIACGKHFPGHGDTITDSHKVLPVVTATRERLYAIELLPFRHAIGQGLRTIMTAHVRYPALDPQFPATLSRIILSDLLRTELRFQGVTITDDLEMNAILDHGSVGEAAVQSLRAGADILLVCHRQDRQSEVIRAIEQALESGDLSMEQIRVSAERIQVLKQDFLEKYTPVDISQLPNIVGLPKHQVLLEKIHQVAARA